jgi:hypothetical protein
VVLVHTWREEEQKRALSPRCGEDSQLLLKSDRRSADSGGLELNGYLDAVSNLYEGDATVHPILLPIKGHRSVDGSGPRACAFHLEGELFGQPAQQR